MKRRTVVLIGVTLVAGIIGLAYLKTYSLQLIHAIVVNALIQKAPDGYEQARIETVFQRRLQEAVKSKAEGNLYLQDLKKLFHRLEKRQRLEAGELDTILQSMESG